jgi:hypothetical protein
MSERFVREPTGSAIAGMRGARPRVAPREKINQNGWPVIIGIRYTVACCGINLPEVGLKSLE